MRTKGALRHPFRQDCHFNSQNPGPVIFDGRPQHRTNTHHHFDHGIGLGSIDICGFGLNQNGQQTGDKR